MAWRGRRVAYGVAILVALLLSACGGPWSNATATAASPGTPVARENRLTGSQGWEQDFRGTGISGYVEPATVQAGGTVGIAVSTTANIYDIDIYRVGWYGGVGARLVRSAHGLPGVNQGQWTPGTFGVTSCSTCEYDPQTGLLEPRWLVTYTFTIPSSWVSGDYLIHMTTSAGRAGTQFVVRDDRRASQVLAVLPLNTYQAYNNWGGKSLYGSNSFGPATVASGPFARAATRVSLERPYATSDRWRQDFETVAFLERAGYDVTYAMSVDLDRDPALLARHRIVIVVGHDEYWSRDMRDHVEAARDGGTNVIFLGGNDVYWQVRYAAGSDGSDRSILICYRSAAIDPVAATDPRDATVMFSGPPLLRPASTLTGTVYTDPILVQPSPWVLARTAPAWLLAGTRLVPGGSSIAGLVGVECDRYDQYSPHQASLVVVSDSPVVKTGGAASHCNTVYYRAASGAQVFNAGTWSWEDFLSGRAQNAAVVRMTANLMARFGAATS